MIFSKKFFLVLLLLLPASLAAQKNVSFLFDNSGSMLGYYSDNKSTFKIFAKALIKNSLAQGDFTNIFLFTKNEPKRGIQSPQKIFSGLADDLIIDKIISNFKPVKGNDGDFGVTDINEALDVAISDIKNEPALIWLITDNINDIAGTGDDSFINTLEFYKKLRNDSTIRKILLFPIEEKLSGNLYESTGFVCYGIVYSKIPLSQNQLEFFDKIIRASGIKVKPFTLKPLDIGTISLFPKVTQTKITEGKLFFDGKTLRGFGFDEGQIIKETFPDLVLKSNLFPYIIKKANLSVRLDNFSSSDYSVKSMGTQTISPSYVSNVSPEGEVTGFSVTFNMPEITPNFSFATIFNEDFTVGGNLILEVSNVDIILDDNYMNSFKDLFALSSVPDIFRPVLKDKKIETSIPLEIRIKYGSWRLFALFGLAIIALAFIAFPVFLLTKKSCYIITLSHSDPYSHSGEGDSLSFCISALSSFSVSSPGSPVLGKIKKSLSGSLKFICSSVTDTPGKVFAISDGIPFTVSYTDTKTYDIDITLQQSNKKSSDFNNSDSNSFNSDISKYH